MQADGGLGVSGPVTVNDSLCGLLQAEPAVRASISSHFTGHAQDL